MERREAFEQKNAFATGLRFPLEMPASLLPWVLFTGGVLALLLVDLFVIQRKWPHASVGQSVIATLTWVALSAAFGLWITAHGGAAKGLEFFTGYVIEYSLSMDNIFIFVLIFSSFQVPAHQQHRPLFWGVLGAMIMRGLMVGLGTVLLARFLWITYVFGGYILLAGITMLLPRRKTSVEDKRIVRWTRRVLPLSSNKNTSRLVVREHGRWMFTYLFLVLVVVELTDLVFALDSVPAVFGVTHDPYLVYTSNICAILGLRSLYFLLAGAMSKLTYLHAGLSALLIFIGAKMLGEHYLAVPTAVSLGVVVGILACAVLASLLFPRKAAHA